MSIRTLTQENELQTYNKWVHAHEHGTLWQSLEWKGYQEALGREVRVYVEEKEDAIVASALVVIDRTAMGLCTWDIPRGPLGQMDNGQWTMDNLLNTIVVDAKKDTCVSLYLSPLQPVVFNCPLSIINSVRNEQPSATRIIDLTASESEILSQMKQKGRYNIKVAQKHNVTVQESKDIDTFYELLKATAKRDRYQIKPKSHYKAFLEHLEGSFLLLASAPVAETRPSTTLRLNESPLREAIGGLLGIMWGSVGTYYYGASNHAERAKMAPYLLQWESIRRCKSAKCTKYDLFGVIPRGEQENRHSEEQGTPPVPLFPCSPEPSSHPWAGISAFKEKFGGTIVQYPPEQEIILKPIAKNVLTVKRKLFG